MVKLNLVLENEIETDIHQLVSQLTAVLGKVKEGDNKKAFEIMNPAINYYKF